MITIRRSQDRGHADHGWLDTYHTFSFADYHDPDHMGFGPLRVINQDRVRPSRGFPTHGHRDMEIVSYVVEGVMEHKDSMGHGSRIRPGDVQLMSAGTGVTHSEYNASSEEELHLLQMWVLPRELGTRPRYEQETYPVEERRGRLRLVVSPDGRDGSLTIGQDAELHVGILAAGDSTEHDLATGRAAWLHVARGRVDLAGEELGPGDGAAVQDETGLALRALDDTELVLWEFPS